MYADAVSPRRAEARSTLGNRSMRFEGVEKRMPRSAMDLFERMGELHLSRSKSKPAEFQYLVFRALGGSDSTELIWLGGQDQRSVSIEHDPADFESLQDVGLVRRASGKNTYRIPTEAIVFYENWIKASGETPSAQIEHVIRTLIDDPTRLRRNHPEAARHLADAFDVLWAETLDDVTIVNIGGSLRSALNAMSADLVGHETSPEKVATVLKPWLAANPTVPPRQDELLTAMVKAAVSSSQRLNHLHDERSEGQPDPTREEIRRTAFAVSLCCYELDRLASP